VTAPQRVPTTDRQQAEQLFLDYLPTIEKLIRFVASRASLRDAEAEDFGSHVKIRLIENDYHIIRRFEGRSPFPSYLSTVVHRLLLDYRIQLWGKWHASSEARRLGPVAIALELAVQRDGKSVAEALLFCRKVDPAVTLEYLEKLAARLPKRLPKARLVSIETASDAARVPADTVSQRTFEAERSFMANSAAGVVKAAIDKLPEDDRLVLRLHFGAGLSVAEVARSLGAEQKPLYRRIKRSLRELKRRLEIAGIKATSIDDIVAGCGGHTDFGLGMENIAARPSVSDDRKDEHAEDRLDDD